MSKKTILGPSLSTVGEVWVEETQEVAPPTQAQYDQLKAAFLKIVRRGNEDLFYQKQIIAESGI